MKSAHGRSGWLGLAALVLVAGALIPAALALACNPQAYLTLDKTAYGPGDNVRVSGSFFKNDASITVSIDRTGQSTTVTTSGNGAFSTTFALPANAPTGGYTVQAIGFEANGQITAGLPARGSFSVAAAQAAPQPAPSGGEPASAPQQSAPAGQPAAPQAAATRPSTQRPTASKPAGGFREPSVFNEPNVQRSGTERSTSNAGSPSKAGSTTGAGGSGAGETAVNNGRAVFGGSVAPSISAPAVSAAGTPASAPASAGAGSARSRGASQSPAVSRQAAEQTAADDVWSAVGSGSSPSVLPFAGDGVAVSSPRSGSQLALGLVLLGGGVLALVGGLAAGEARRRRVSAR